MPRHRNVAKLEFDLKQGLSRGEFVLKFQPLVDLETATICGFEALIRWNSEKRGVVSPNDFIPVAEQIGLISEIGKWVLRQACKTAAEWPDHLTVAVNLSPLQFSNNEIVDIVRESLSESGLAPNRLELEITEGSIIDNTLDVLSQLEELKALGVSIAMDDFGTGYSSLAYLWRFPFDKIKIDRSFVSALGQNEPVEDILRTILSLGRSLQLRVVAEGVENELQASFLREIACDQLQGFYCGRPMPDYDVARCPVERFP